MPKQVVNYNDILETAFDMTRKQGFLFVNARSVAKVLGLSVQPIYSYFKNMTELKNTLYTKALEFYNNYIYSKVNNENILQSMAIANIDFAKNETNLFKLLFLSKLDGINSFSDIYERMGDKKATEDLAKKLKVSEDNIKRLYIRLIIFTHGIATILATSGAKISDEEIAALIENAYQAFIEVEK